MWCAKARRAHEGQLAPRHVRGRGRERARGVRDVRADGWYARGRQLTRVRASRADDRRDAEKWALVAQHGLRTYGARSFADVSKGDKPSVLYTDFQ